MLPTGQDNKYRMFRNYMVNELGIAKEDIEAWTRQAVTAEAGKLVGQMNVEETVKRAVHDAVRAGPHGQGLNPDLKKHVASEILALIASKVEITIKD